MSGDLTARDVIARHMQRGLEPLSLGRRYADDVLAALAAAGYTIVTTDDLTDLATDIKRMTSVHKTLGKWGEYPMAVVAERLDSKLREVVPDAR